MTTDNEAEEFKKKLEALKPKKKVDASAEILKGAEDHEGKVLAIRIIADRELKRTVLLFKGMLKPEPPKKVVEVVKEQTKKPPEKKKSFLGKK
jgi:hypothetical protein